MLHFGFSYGLLDEETPETKEMSKRRFERLTEGEKQFFHADPFMQVGLCNLLLCTDVRVVVPSSVVVIFDRYLRSAPETMFQLLNWISKNGVRDTDPEDYRELCKKFAVDPFGNRVLLRSATKRIFTYWLLDRFGGTSTNIHTKTDAEFRAKVKEMDHHETEKEHVVVPSTHTKWSKERTALFETWAKEPVPA